MDWDPLQHGDTKHPGYASAHRYIGQVKGSAAVHLCVDCAGPAVQWSRDNDTPVDTRDPEHYAPRCVGCHVIYDNTWRHVFNLRHGVRGRFQHHRSCTTCARAIRMGLATGQPGNLR